VKRFGLASVTLLLLAVLLWTPANAASLSFTDASIVENTGAVGMLCDLGIISGYSDGSFRPRSTISRQEVTRMVAMLLTDTPTSTTKTAAFSDVPLDSAYAPYIYYCYENGFISGAHGAFSPTSPITAQQLAKILLGALGYDTSRYTGSGWTERVDEDAAAIGLYDGFFDYYDTPINRDDACLLMFNALQSYPIKSFDASGNPVYYLDDLMNPQTLMEYRYGVVMYTELLIANEYADMTTTDGRLEDGYSQLEHHRALPISTGLGMLGRNIVIYARDGVVLGVPTYSPFEGYYTFDDFNDFAVVLQRLKLTLSSETQFYYNYNVSTRLALVRAGDNVEITIVDHTGDGVLDVVLMIEYQTATVSAIEDGVLTAAIDDGEPFEVTVEEPEQLERLAAGDEISVAWIGGRWLLKNN
jgi:hypothetical protein